MHFIHELTTVLNTTPMTNTTRRSSKINLWKISKPVQAEPQRRAPVACAATLGRATVVKKRTNVYEHWVVCQDLLQLLLSGLQKLQQKPAQFSHKFPRKKYYYYYQSCLRFGAESRCLESAVLIVRARGWMHCCCGGTTVARGRAVRHW